MVSKLDGIEPIVELIKQYDMTVEDTLPAIKTAARYALAKCILDELENIEVAKQEEYYEKNTCMGRPF